MGNAVDPGEVAICVVFGNGPEYGGEFARKYSWPRLQLAQLRRHTPPGFRLFVYGSMLMADQEEFLRSCPEVRYFANVPNADARTNGMVMAWRVRNWLARQAARTHRWLIHLDSDAFPVRDGWLDRYAGCLNDECPVIAVKRVENGDNHSDRCFMMFRREAFRRHTIDLSDVGVVDVGGGVSEEIEQAGLRWHALLRSNRHDYHPLIAGIYDDCIYHHAAGSRAPRFRVNYERLVSDGAFRLEQQAIHRVLMIRLFEHTNQFLEELRGNSPPVDMGERVQRMIASLQAEQASKAAGGSAARPAGGNA